jgi:hypothetical protein
MMKLCVAGVPIRIESAHPEWAAKRYAEYVREDDRPSQMDITIRVMDEIPTPEGELIHQIQASSILKTGEHTYCRYSRQRSGDIYVAHFYNDDYTQVEIQIWKNQGHPVLTVLDWEYSLTGFAFQDRLTLLGQGILHSSSLAWRGRGVCFSANSGTGKSTHVGLWCQRFGDEVTIINDDKPALLFEDDRVYLCGTPWSGKTDLNTNQKVPLEAIVFVKRGEQNSIRRLDALESYYYLNSQIGRPYYDAAVGEKMVTYADRLLANVPIYELTCNISIEAVETVVKEIFPQEDIG